MELQPTGVLFLLVSLPIALIDLHRRRVPDLLSIGGLVVAIGLLAAACPFDLPHHLAASALAFSMLFLVRMASGHKLGLGDVKYGAFMGLTLGVEGWLVALLSASILGLLVTTSLIGCGLLGPRSRIPFAPFLAAGGALWLLAGRALVSLFDGGTVT